MVKHILTKKPAGTQVPVTKKPVSKQVRGTKKPGAKGETYVLMMIKPALQVAQFLSVHGGIDVFEVSPRVSLAAATPRRERWQRALANRIIRACSDPDHWGKAVKATFLRWMPVAQVRTCKK